MPHNPLCPFERECKPGEVRRVHNGEPRQRGGTIIYGPPRDLGECVNRTMKCDTCGSTGEESVVAEEHRKRIAAELKRSGGLTQPSLFEEG